MFLAFEDPVPANCAFPFLTQEADAVMQLIETASGAGAVGMERRLQGRCKQQSGQAVRARCEGYGRPEKPDQWGTGEAPANSELMWAVRDAYRAPGSPGALHGAWHITGTE